MDASLQPVESDSDTADDSLDETMELEEFGRGCDWKKWIAFAQISLGFILIVLEIANVSVLNPWFRIFCPGIWIGMIFLATGAASLAYYRLDKLQERNFSGMATTPAATAPSHSKAFRIVYLTCNALSLTLCVAMIVMLAIVIDALRQEMRSPTDSVTAMMIVMLVVYILVALNSIAGFVCLARQEQCPEPEKSLESAAHVVFTRPTISENPV